MKKSNIENSCLSFREQLHLHLNDIHSGLTCYINIALTVIILLSVLCSMAVTIKGLAVQDYEYLHIVEYICVTIFSIEFLLRLYSAPSRWAYLRSPFGVIDFLSIVPVFFLGSGETLALRLLRAVALLRMIKLLRYTKDMQVLLQSLHKSAMVLSVLLGGIVLLALFSGNLIYMLEPENFHSAFDGAWWSLVTMSTVGYGDYVPHTFTGKIVAGGEMIIGVSLFACVTGLVSLRISDATKALERADCKACCSSVERKSHYCSHCGVAAPVTAPLTNE